MAEYGNLGDLLEFLIESLATFKRNLTKCPTQTKK